MFFCSTSAALRNMLPAMSMLDGTLLVAFAVFFNRLAAMERRSGLIWTLASIAASLLAMFAVGIHILLAQALLFCVMWFLNFIKPDKKIDVE